LIGAVLSVFIIGLLRYGLGLINVPAQVLLIIVGLLLIVAIAVPNLRTNFSRQHKVQSSE
jgi:rhamnose transport system permease protein